MGKSTMKDRRGWSFRRMSLFISRKNDYVPYVSSATAFREGCGWILVFPPILALVCISALNAGMCFLLFEKMGKGGVLAICFFVFSLCLALVMTLRRERSRRAHFGDALHKLFHEIRKCVCDVCLQLESTTPEMRLDLSEEGYRSLNTEVVEHVASLFRSYVRDETVNCAIRLAVASRDGDLLYATVARSSGMLPERKELSVGVPANEGIVAQLRNRDNRGVCIIRDIKRAADDGMWYRTPTDGLPDVTSVMVAPINGYEGGRLANYGFLFVTSRDGTFFQIDALPMMAIADFLGIVYPWVYLNKFTGTCDLGRVL